MSVFIIAEAGVNHNGSIDIAKNMIDSAKEAGVDCIKFQTYIATNIVSKNAPKAAYQVENSEATSSENQYEMLKRLELTFDNFVELRDYCRLVGIEFLSTAFDLESVDFLNSLGMLRWKIPSGEITNLPYLMRIGELKQQVILSTGMSSIEDVAAAVGALRDKGTTDIILLHCTTEYPTPFEEVNLLAMKTLANTFGLPIGYSDHSIGITIAIAAVAMGAVVIEKHFTLDQTMEGPDHKASLEPKALKEMVEAIRNVEIAIGDGEKRPTRSELQNMVVARKSIIAKTLIHKGDIFSTDNLTVKRPGNGISPMMWFEVIGMSASRDFMEDELIEI